MTSSDFVSKVTHEFYNIVKTDILIGYHFRNIPDFEVHIPRIVAFWEIQLLGISPKSVTPPFDLINLHSPLGIKRGELGRWLLLFRKILDQELDRKPEFKELGILWKERLEFFEKVFSRFFSA